MPFLPYVGSLWIFFVFACLKCHSVTFPRLRALVLSPLLSLASGLLFGIFCYGLSSWQVYNLGWWGKERKELGLSAWQIHT